MTIQTLIQQLESNEKWVEFLGGWSISTAKDGWSVDPETGIATCDCDWDYAGRWSDYAVDAHIDSIGEDEDEEDESADSDEIGENWVNNRFKDSLEVISREVGCTITFILSDGEVSFFLDHKPAV